MEESCLPFQGISTQLRLSLYMLLDLPHNNKNNKCNIRVIVWFTVTVAIDIHFCLISEMSLYVGVHDGH